MDLHGPGGTGRNTEFTNTAFFLIKFSRHFGPLDQKRTGETNGRAGTAMGAFFLTRCTSWDAFSTCIP